MRNKLYLLIPVLIISFLLTGCIEDYRRETIESAKDEAEAVVEDYLDCLMEEDFDEAAKYSYVEEDYDRLPDMSNAYLRVTGIYESSTSSDFYVTVEVSSPDVSAETVLIYMGYEKISREWWVNTTTYSGTAAEQIAKILR